MNNKIKLIAHLADIHIRTYRLHEEYKLVFENLIKDLTMTFRRVEYEEARIVIVGDLFHQKITVSNEQTILASWFLNELSQIAPVVLVAGNHDLLENNKKRLDSITPIINLINNPNISYYKESLCYEDDNIIWANFSIFQENERPDIGASRKQHPDKKHIGLFHAPLIGAKTDIGYTFDTGENVSHFTGCDFVLLGDIHMHQEIVENGVRCVYPSSLIQQNFGESINNHGYLLWDLDTDQYEMKEIDNDFLSVTFKITSLEDLEQGKEKLVNG